jgi:hypothetical protein
LIAERQVDPDRELPIWVGMAEFVRVLKAGRSIRSSQRSPARRGRLSGQGARDKEAESYEKTDVPPKDRTSLPIGARCLRAANLERLWYLLG